MKNNYINYGIFFCIGVVVGVILDNNKDNFKKIFKNNKGQIFKNKWSIKNLFKK